MPFTLSFRANHRYNPSGIGVTVPVVHTAGFRTAKVLAKIDTGADYCLFDRGYAEALQIEVEHGTPQDFSTVGGSFRAYGHELTLTVLGIELHSHVFFFEDASVSRNVLGRNGWLNRVRLGLVDHDSELYVSSYNDA